MELVEGPSVASVMSARGRLATTDVLRIGLAIADALSAAHAAGVIHRDLKPDNVLLEGDRVVITDFGVAATMQSDEPRATSAGGLVGTPAYMAPEQVEGGPVDARTDLYALGVVLFESTSGRLPFSGNSIIAIAAARLVTPAPDLASVVHDCPPGLASVVARALARDPSARFASADEFAAALHDVEKLLVEGEASPRRSPSSPTGGPLSLPQSGPVERRVAIIPFRNVGPTDDAWLAQGLADDLLDSLAVVSGVRVRARAPELRRDEDLQSYGRRLDVQLLVDGSVRRIEDRVRASLRLVSTSDGFQVWSHRYDAAMRTIPRCTPSPPCESDSGAAPWTCPHRFVTHTTNLESRSLSSGPRTRKDGSPTSSSMGSTTRATSCR
jgi:serine/threonine-protein kinase